LIKKKIIIEETLHEGVEGKTKNLMDFLHL